MRKLRERRRVSPLNKTMRVSMKKYFPIFMLPTLIAFVIGFVWPFLWGIYLSFFKFKINITSPNTYGKTKFKFANRNSYTE